VTALVRAWFSAPDMSMGLWGVELCDHGCHGVRLDDVAGLDGDVVLAGYAGTVAMLLAGGAVALCGLAWMRGGRGPVRAARGLLVAALVGAGWFSLRILVDGHLDLGWALFVGPGAAVAALVALARLTRA